MTDRERLIEIFDGWKYRIQKDTEITGDKTIKFFKNGINLRFVFDDDDKLCDIELSKNGCNESPR